MKLTPLDILRREFRRKAFNGLDPEDVERFLEDVAEGVEGILAENAELRRQIAQQERRATAAERVTADAGNPILVSTRAEEDARRTLEVARREAQEVLARAHSEAQRVLSDAQKKREALATSPIRELAVEYRSVLEDHLDRIRRFLDESGGDAPADDRDATVAEAEKPRRISKERTDDGSERRF
jgi:cell division initiation protein